MVKASLEIANLLTFLVCKSSTNRLRKEVLAFMQMSEQMGSHLGGLQVDELVNRLIKYETSLYFFVN